MVLFLSFTNAEAAPQVAGYAVQMPNEFWPDTTSPLSTGDTIQQRSPFTNPDRFCKLKGDNYRLPSIGEFQGALRSTNPWAPNNAAEPGHFSNYVGGDVANPRLPNFDNVADRRVGALINEWGPLNVYANGWDQQGYWATEPYSGGQLGRFAINQDGTARSDGITAESQNGVVCVESLVESSIETENQS